MRKCPEGWLLALRARPRGRISRPKRCPRAIRECYAAVMDLLLTLIICALTGVLCFRLALKWVLLPLKYSTVYQPARPLPVARRKHS